jgi:hypothetical protein
MTAGERPAALDRRTGLRRHQARTGHHEGGAHRTTDGVDRSPCGVDDGRMVVRLDISERLLAEKIRLALASERANQLGMHCDS